MPMSGSRMGSNRSQTDVLVTIADKFVGPFKKGQKSPKKFMPNITKKNNKKAY